MTNFLIGYPDIPAQATTLTASGTVSTTYPQKYSVTGGRQMYTQLSSDASSVYYQYEIPNDSTAEYLFVAGAKLLKAGGATKLLLSNATGGGAFTNRIGTTASLQTRTFSGPNSEDLMFTASFNDDIGASLTATETKWRVESSGYTGKYPIRKVYFGSFFDMGREPVYDYTRTRMAYSPNARRERWIYSLTWKGITDSKLGSFSSTILKYKDINPVVLWDQNNYVLDGFYTLHAWVKNPRITPTALNTNTIEIDFEELI